MKTLSGIRPDEVSLIHSCLQQDRKAQRNLYEKYKNGMFTVAFRMLNDRDDAHDVLQEAFIQVFRDLAKFQQRSTLGAWIKTIVVRCALKKIKKQKPILPLEAKHDRPIVWSDELTGEYLDKAIRALPDGYRSVFVMIEVEGYSHKEVAHMLGIKEGTSKSQLYHAKRQLQKLLADLR